MNEVGRAKAVSIFNSEDEIARAWYEKYKDEQGRRCILYSADDVGESVREVFGLPGRMNLSNLAGATAIARCFGVSDDTIAGAMGSFKGLAHRLELVSQVDGVRWYNDSISTTPESSIAALEAFDQRKIIIAGGYDKGLDFGQFGKVIAERAKGAVLIGATRQKIAGEIVKACGGKFDVEFADSLADAVDKAAARAKNGNVVLLSPACASYDMFDNFEHRGREFVRLVKKLNSDK
jgi:UDP-N-acetylmuramoylalanine--D-glutamate ligase